jgi:predicted site-specific integrase-resolvase
MEEQTVDKQEKVEEVVKVDEKEELQNQLNRIVFFADQVRFNAILYDGMSLLMEKVSKIQETLDAKK